jgi:hypothetical protein
MGHSAIIGEQDQAPAVVVESTDIMEFSEGGGEQFIDGGPVEGIAGRA